MASAETQFDEPSSTNLVDDNHTNEVDDVILLDFVGTDPDAKVNVFSNNPSSKKYTAVKGPVNNGQYHPGNYKAIKLVEEAYTKYIGTKFEGLAGKDDRSPPLALSVYKDIVRKHLIKNGLWDVFSFCRPKPRK
eukprot:9970983-Ditylum_brightwellii.AAC.1